MKDNAADSVKRGQQLRGEQLSRTFKTRCHGRSHHSNKLTEVEVIRIRGSGLSLSEIASQFGISKTTAAKIKKNLIWKHLNSKENAA